MYIRKHFFFNFKRDGYNNFQKKKMKEDRSLNEKIQ